MTTTVYYIFFTEMLNENYTTSEGFLGEYKFHD